MLMLRAGTQTKKRETRKFQLEVESLEARVVPCGDELGTGNLLADHDGCVDGADFYPAVLTPQPTGSVSSTGSTTTAAATGGAIPVLNSLAGAPATLGSPKWFRAPPRRAAASSLLRVIFKGVMTGAG